ncbi:MAG: hypothetical protein H0X65_10250 [Gemmatimonadetes bacterium]|nr:hypothetical protein [Gemmatimonadota bacterium]
MRIPASVSAAHHDEPCEGAFVNEVVNVRLSALSPLLRFGPRSLLYILLGITGCDWHGAAYPSEPDARSLVVHGMLAEGAPASATRGRLGWSGLHLFR